MAKAKLFLLVWTFFLLIAAGLTYYFVVGKKSPVELVTGMLNLNETARTAEYEEGWLGRLLGSKEEYKLYPANEISIYIPTESNSQEHSKYYQITIERLSEKDFMKVEDFLKEANIRYEVSKKNTLFGVTVTFENKEAMDKTVIALKALNIGSKKD